MQENYTSIANYVAPFAVKAKKRYDKGEYWWELRSCAYYGEFEAPKIALAEIAQMNHFTLDCQRGYYDTTAYIIGKDDLCLLGLLNSKLLLFYFKAISSQIRGGFLRWKRQYMTQLPISTADEETKTGIQELVEQVLAAKQADAAADTSALEAEIDLLVYRLYNLTYEEVLLVEPKFALPKEAYEANLFLQL